jgi:hypothetical protein
MCNVEVMALMECLDPHSQNVSISEGRVAADVELPDPKTKVLVK